jgi:acyl carrier protein
LVAYVVAKAQIQSELRPYLKEKLPAYMVPAAFVMLDALPLTANGKVDRRALPSPDQERPTLETAHVAPQGKLEQAIATIWQEILQVERVGIYDNFFDLGGHSLLVVETQQRLRQILNREIPVTELFKYTTVATLATHLGQEQTDKDNRHDEVVQKTKARAAERRRSLPRWTRQRRQKPVSPEDGE